MELALLFPEFMDLSKPCVLCRYYCKSSQACKSHSVRDTVRRIEKERERGEVIEYEYGQKYCTPDLLLARGESYQKSYVFPDLLNGVPRLAERSDERKKVLTATPC